MEVSENNRDHENIDERNFEKEKPTESHELVPAKTRERPPHPHHEKDNHRTCEQPFADIFPITDKWRDQPALLDLILKNACQAQISDEKENRNHRQTERELVRNHL